jgi:hypothetical protein
MHLTNAVCGKRYRGLIVSSGKCDVLGENRLSGGACLFRGALDEVF